MKGFFSMRAAERAMLLFLVLFSIFAFLPPWREIEVAGMVLLGWWMALLMVLSPAMTLAVFLWRRRR